MKPALRVIAQAFALAAVASLMGLGFNLVRSEGLALMAEASYQLFRPCPVVAKEADAIQVVDLPADLSGFVVVDARRRDEFDAGHVPGARSIPYDPLESPSESLLTGLRQLRAEGILVIGDTDLDSGRLLGAELAGAGLKKVGYLAGGFPAWEASGRPVTREAP